MSLEQAIKENTEAVNSMIALFKQDIELRQQALGKVSEAIAKSTGGKASAAAAAADKVKAETAAPKAKADDGDDAMKQAKAAIASYVGGTERAEERKARSAKIVKLLSHPKVKADGSPDTVKDLKDVKPEALKSIISNVTKFIEAGDLTEAPSDDDDGDIDLD